MSVRLICELLSELFRLYDENYKELYPINDIIYERIRLIVDTLKYIDKITIDAEKYRELGIDENAKINSLFDLFKKSRISGIKFIYDNEKVTHSKSEGNKVPRYYINNVLMEQYCHKCTYFKSLEKFNKWTKQQKSHCSECNSKKVLSEDKIIRDKKFNDLISDSEYTSIKIIEGIQYRKCIDCKRFTNLTEYNILRSTCNTCMEVLEHRKIDTITGRVKLLHKFTDDGEYKYCSSCYLWYTLDKFHYDNSKHDKLHSTCKECQYFVNCNNLNTEEGKNKKRIYENNKRANNIEFKIACILRGRLRDVLKTTSKDESALKLVGCSIKKLESHLESLFETGMTWNNMGRNGWHIDHIIPCAVYSLENIEEQKCCFHYLNLQPLWEKDNISKGSKITKEVYLKHRPRLCDSIRSRLDKTFEYYDDIESCSDVISNISDLCSSTGVL